MEAEGTLASVKLLQEKNLEAGGGPIETEVHEAYREVPTDNESRRDAAMKMVAEVAGKIGGQAAAQLYQEVDRLYPSTEPVQGTPLLDPEGNQIGVKPPWSDTTITTRRGMWDPSRVDTDGNHEEVSRSIDSSGNVRITYAPRETPKRLVLFPGGNRMYAMTDASAGKMNEHLDGMFSSIKMLDQILEIAETADWETRKLDFSTRAKAKLLRTLLIGKMRVTLVGPGVVSNFDYEQLMKAIDDPTEVFNIDNIITGGESSIVKIRILKEQMNNSLLDKAANAGFTAPGSKYRLPEKYRKFDSLETAREFGFKAGDIVWIKGINPNKKPYEYQQLRLKERTIGNP
jgi:hypothetical protein